MNKDLFSMTVLQRLKVVRKVLFRKLPYLLIPRKPRELIQSRPGDYELSSVKEAIDIHQSTIALMVELLAPFKEQYISLVADGEIDERGGYFGGLDGACAYAMVRHLNPRTILEVGCGQSTHIMHRALIDNGPDNRKSKNIVCIDPEPRKSIEEVANEIYLQSAVKCKADMFSILKEDDILFIDGSHYSFNGTDATYLFLEILPLLKRGVVVHIHDVFLPYEYPEEFSRRLYNEQYLLAATVMNLDAWEVLLPVYAEHAAGRFGDVAAGSSFWMRRK